MVAPKKALPSMTEKELVRELCKRLSETAKDELFLRLMADRCLRWLGIESEEEFLEQVHRDIRKQECLRKGIPFDEYESRKTFFICPSPDGFSHHVRIKDRTTDSSLPRYYCENCGKVYSALTNTLLYKKGFDIVKWYTFIDCMMNGQTLQEISRKCSISIATANEWRLRLFAAVEELQKNVRLSGLVEADETFIKTNYSGKNMIEKSGVIRSARKRGHSTPMADIHKDEVCIFCAVDTYGNCIAKITGIGLPSALNLVQTAADSFDVNRVELFVTDGGKALAKFADICNLRHLPLVSRHKKHYGYVPQIKREEGKEYSIQHINAMHSQLKQFLRDFRGVSSQYLSGYLSLFTYKHSRGNSVVSPDSYLDILRALITPIRSYTTEELKTHFEPLIYKAPVNSKLADFSQDQITIYARYVGECESSPDIKDALAAEYDITPGDVDTLIKAFERNPKLRGTNGLAYRWYQREMRTASEEKKRQAKLVTRNTYHRNVIADYTSGIPVTDISEKYGVSHQRIYKILKDHKDAGEIIRRPPRERRKKPMRPHKETQAEFFFRKYEDMKRLHPKMPLSEISQNISKETGFPVGYVNAAISRERIKRTGKRKRRVTPKDTRIKLIQEYELLCRNVESEHLTKQQIYDALARKYKVKKGTVGSIIYKHYKGKDKETANK